MRLPKDVQPAFVAREVPPKPIADKIREYEEDLRNKQAELERIKEAALGMEDLQRKFAELQAQRALLDSQIKLLEGKLAEIKDGLRRTAELQKAIDHNVWKLNDLRRRQQDGEK